MYCTIWGKYLNSRCCHNDDEISQYEKYHLLNIIKDDKITISAADFLIDKITSITTPALCYPLKSVTIFELLLMNTMKCIKPYINTEQKEQFIQELKEIQFMEN